VDDVLLQIFQHFLLVDFVHPVGLPYLIQLLPQLINLIPLLDVQVYGLEIVQFIDLPNPLLRPLLLRPDPFYPQFIRMFLANY
jgi:hypothetical protein